MVTTREMAGVASILVKLIVLVSVSMICVMLLNLSTLFANPTSVENTSSSKVSHAQRRPSSHKVIPTARAMTIKTPGVILQYLKSEESRCMKEINLSGNTTNYCPCLPNNLLGRLVPNVSTEFEWSDVSNPSRAGVWPTNPVLAGGQWKPAHCVSNNRLAVIIPCRDRDSHLRVMLRHLIPVLQRQLTHFMIFVVEQNSPAVFNKAAMMNIGFIEAERRFPEMNCVMFHDVDHLMEDDRSLLNCGQEPHHYATGMDEWNYRLIYSGAFGGVVTMQPSLFRKVNGYALTYFGWGGEDDDMGTRVRQHFSVFRPPIEVARYTTLKHLEDKSNPKNEGRHKLMDEQFKRYQKGIYDGISDLKYSLNDVQLRPFYTWLHANLDVTKLPYPKHVVGEYVKIPGTCADPSNVFWSSDVSWTTCRYMCDVEVHRPCAGFTYHAKLSTFTTTSKCELLLTVCRLTTTSTTSGTSGTSGGFTYMKSQH